MLTKQIFKKIGNTPIIKLKNNDIYVKLEQFNFGGSIKSRVAYSMMQEALKDGTLKRNSNQTILEASGGNTAIGLAILCAIYGFNLKLVIPSSYSKKKIDELGIYGVDVVLFDGPPAIKAREIHKQHPEYIYLDQLSNKANPKIHYYETGQEIVREFNHIDYFLAGIGSGGTITGIGKRLKEEFGTHIVGILPTGYSIKDKKFIKHKIQGIGIGMIPSILDMNVVDSYIHVSYDEAMEVGKYLLKEEGLFLGLSSITNIAGAIKLQQSLNKKQSIVTISPDAGDSYIENYKEYYYE